MIESIILQRLKNGEFSQFLQNVLQMVSKNDPAALQVTAQYNALNTIAADIEKLFKVPAGSAITAELESLDQQRDNALNGINYIIKGFTYCYDEELKRHAGVLTAHMAIFGPGIAKDSYQSETASIRNIIADWDQKPELADAIAALQLTGWRHEMEKANNKFDERYLGRAEEMGTSNADKLKEKRLAANEAYYALRNRINGYFEITDGAEPYNKTTAMLNGLIMNYNDLLSRRKPSEDAEPETPPMTNV